MIFQRFIKLPTYTVILGVFIVAIVSLVLERLDSSRFLHWQTSRAALEYVSQSLFWCMYFVLLLLVPISAFRPTNRFSIRGDCAVRARNFLFSAGSVVFVTFLVIFLFARQL